MMSRLGEICAIDIKTTSKPKSEQEIDAYFELDLPVAPAVMVGDGIVVEGADVSDHEVESCVCRHLGLSEPEPLRKGFMDRLRRG